MVSKIRSNTTENKKSDGCLKPITGKPDIKSKHLTYIRHES